MEGLFVSPRKGPSGREVEVVIRVFIGGQASSENSWPFSLPPFTCLWQPGIPWPHPRRWGGGFGGVGVRREQQTQPHPPHHYAD